MSEESLEDLGAMLETAKLYTREMAQLGDIPGNGVEELALHQTVATYPNTALLFTAHGGAD